MVLFAVGYDALKAIAVVKILCSSLPNSTVSITAFHHEPIYSATTL
jgi:hypothetical protein